MSKQFKVECHACGACFADRTLTLISRMAGCYKPTNKSILEGTRRCYLYSQFKTTTYTKRSRYAS